MLNYFETARATLKELGVDMEEADRIEQLVATCEKLEQERDGIREAAWTEALDAAHQYTLMQYGMAFLKHPVDRERILDMIGQRE